MVRQREFVYRRYTHGRSYPKLPAEYNWALQKQLYCPSSLLTNRSSEEEEVNGDRVGEHKFGYVFCHRGLYERASKIVENSDKAIQNGTKQGFFLHEVDTFIFEDLENALLAHDKSAKRVTSRDAQWNSDSFLFRDAMDTNLATRRLRTKAAENESETGTPSIASSYSAIHEQVPGLLSGLWKTLLGNNGVTLQIDCRDKDLAKVLASYSFHISKWKDLSLNHLRYDNITKLYQTPIWKVFESTILKGYNFQFNSFEELQQEIERNLTESFKTKYFETKHLHFFPPLIMAFSAEPLIKLAERTTPEHRHWSRNSYHHIHHTIKKQVSSFTQIGDHGYNFILEIGHSGLGLGYNVETGVATNPLNGHLLKNRDVIFESLVDRAMIDVSLELRNENPQLRFASCTRLPDVITPKRVYKYSMHFPKLAAWPNGEEGLSSRLRAIHGGLYPQSHFVVADDPAAEIAARTWIDQKAGFKLDRCELLHTPYEKWLASAGEDIAHAVNALNHEFLANKVETSSEHAACVAENDTSYSVDITASHNRGPSYPVILPKLGNATVRGADQQIESVGGFPGDFSHRFILTPEESPFPIPIEIDEIHLYNFNTILQSGEIILVGEGASKIKLEKQNSLWNVVASQVAYGAALNGRETIIRNLVISGLNINTSVGTYGSVLGAACSQGHFTIVEYLLEEGADLDLHRARSPLELASARGDQKIVLKILDEYKKGDANVVIPRSFLRNAFYHASMGGHPLVMFYLKQENADINARCGFFGSPLGATCADGNITIAKLLVGYGAHVNTTGKHNSPLFWACYYNRHKVAEWLLAIGAEIDFPVRDDFIPEISKMLFDAGASERSVVHIRARYGFDKRGFGHFIRSPIRALLCSGNSSHEDWRESLSIKKFLFDPDQPERPLFKSDQPKLSNCGCTICCLDERLATSLKKIMRPKMHSLYNSMDDFINHPVYNPIWDVAAQPISDMVLRK